MNATVLLVKALGGGWQRGTDAASAAEARSPSPDVSLR
jgi:hypothetical protein